MKQQVNRLKYAFMSALMLMLCALTLMPANVSAQASVTTSHCNTYFLLTIPAWYNNVNKSSGNLSDGGSCEVASPNEVGGIGPFVWIIALNIVQTVLVVAGYAAVGFIIYGGYKYMTSAGSPDGMVAARKTIMNAVIGLVVSMAAVAIVRTVSLGIGLGSTEEDTGSHFNQLIVYEATERE